MGGGGGRKAGSVPTTTPRSRRPLCPLCGVNRLSSPETERCASCYHGRKTADSAQAAADFPRTFEKEWATWQKHLGQARDRYAGPSKRAARVGRLKILVLGDLHVPFHEPAFLAAALEREKDADVVVVNGDIGDGYALSRFTKYESVPYEQELAAIQIVLETLSERFPRVVLIEGNHDAPRFERKLRELLDPDMIAAILAMTGGHLDPLHVLLARYPNIERGGFQTPTKRLRWLHVEGDAVFTHAEKFSITPGAALRKIEEWLSDMASHLRLPTWRLLVQAHTHQIASVPWHDGRLLVEGGCLCQQHGYQLGARIGGRPQRRGYVTLEQVDGVTDLNTVRPVWLDVDPRLA